MPSEETARLAAAGGEVLVEAMPTRVWPTAREQALVLFRTEDSQRMGVLESWLDESAELVRGAGPDEREELHREQASAWRRRLDKLIIESPSAEEELRGLIGRIRSELPAASRPGNTMTNIAKDHGTVFAAQGGNVIQHNYQPRPRKPAGADGDEGRDEGGGCGP